MLGSKKSHSSAVKFVLLISDEMPVKWTLYFTGEEFCGGFRLFPKFVTEGFDILLVSISDKLPGFIVIIFGVVIKDVFSSFYTHHIDQDSGCTF